MRISKLAKEPLKPEELNVDVKVVLLDFFTSTSTLKSQKSGIHITPSGFKVHVYEIPVFRFPKIKASKINAVFLLSNTNTKPST